MEIKPENPKSEVEILAEKKEKLRKTVSLMLDFKKSQQIEKNLLPQLDNLTSEEVDYCLGLVRIVDNQMQFRGPISSMAGAKKAELEAKLSEIEKNIGAERAKELQGLIG